MLPWIGVGQNGWLVQRACSACDIGHAEATFPRLLGATQFSLVAAMHQRMSGACPLPRRLQAKRFSTLVEPRVETAKATRRCAVPGCNDLDPPDFILMACPRMALPGAPTTGSDCPIVHPACADRKKLHWRKLSCAHEIPIWRRLMVRVGVCPVLARCGPPDKQDASQATAPPCIVIVGSGRVALSRHRGNNRSCTSIRQASLAACRVPRRRVRRCTSGRSQPFPGFANSTAGSGAQPRDGGRAAGVVRHSRSGHAVCNRH